MTSQTIRNFGKMGDAIAIPNLIEIQRTSYNRFLQDDVKPMKRENKGLQALLTEIFPIVSLTVNLTWLRWEMTLLT